MDGAEGADVVPVASQPRSQGPVSRCVAVAEPESDDRMRLPGWMWPLVVV